MTKGKQWIRLNKSVELLDTPGILWPKFEDQAVGLRIALIGSINDEILVTTELGFELCRFPAPFCFFCFLQQRAVYGIRPCFLFTEEERRAFLDRLAGDNRAGVQRLLEKYRREEKKLADERARITPARLPPASRSRNARRSSLVRPRNSSPCSIAAIFWTISGTGG